VARKLLQNLFEAKTAPPHAVTVEYHLPDANCSSVIEKFKLIAPDNTAIVFSECDFQL
jgi:hypothetical protein